MRSFLAGFLTTALLLAAAGPASALPSTGELVNWTDTEIGSNFMVSSFEFDEDSPYALSGGFDFPVVNTESVFSGLSVLGTIITITIPNFFDPLPEKNVYIAFNGDNPGIGAPDFPFVVSVVGSDSPFPNGGGGSSPVFGSRVSVICTSMEGLCEEEWLLEPNPDFETITAFIPTTFEFNSMQIITQSVPEPSTLALVACGLVGLTRAGRRRA